MICTSLSLRLPLFEIGIGNTYIYNSASPNFHIPLVFPWAESFWPKKTNILAVHVFALFHTGQILRQYERGICYVGVQNHRSWTETTRWEEIKDRLVICHSNWNKVPCRPTGYMPTRMMLTFSSHQSKTIYHYAATQSCNALTVLRHPHHRLQDVELQVPQVFGHVDQYSWDIRVLNCALSSAVTSKN